MVTELNLRQAIAMSAVGALMDDRSTQPTRDDALIALLQNADAYADAFQRVMSGRNAKYLVPAIGFQTSGDTGVSFKAFVNSVQQMRDLLKARDKLPRPVLLDAYRGMLYEAAFPTLGLHSGQPYPRMAHDAPLMLGGLVLVNLPLSKLWSDIGIDCIDLTDSAVTSCDLGDATWAKLAADRVKFSRVRFDGADMTGAGSMNAAVFRNGCTMRGTKIGIPMAGADVSGIYYDKVTQFVGLGGHDAAALFALSAMMTPVPSAVSMPVANLSGGVSTMIHLGMRV
jgi:hypothetical protein